MAYSRRSGLLAELREIREKLEVAQDKLRDFGTYGFPRLKDAEDSIRSAITSLTEEISEGSDPATFIWPQGK